MPTSVTDSNFQLIDRGVFLGVVGIHHFWRGFPPPYKSPGADESGVNITRRQSAATTSAFWVSLAKNRWHWFGWFLFPIYQGNPSIFPKGHLASEPPVG